MFRRTFWFTAGAAAGIWATTKVNRKLRQRRGLCGGRSDRGRQDGPGGDSTFETQGGPLP